VFNWAIALIIDKSKNPSYKKLLLAGTIVINIGILIWYKYIGFLIASSNSVFGFSFHIPPAILPLGISFFTFHALSYVIDVYRGTVQANKRLPEIALYILLFPQLIAGPIVRYGTVSQQLRDRIHSWDHFSAGVLRFIRGLAQKVLIADIAGKVASTVFAIPTHDLSFSATWIGILFYTIQIYFDFSGYSSMAIGLAKMSGFDFQENFNFPYISKSITEFWTRWHISLSTGILKYPAIFNANNIDGV